MGEIIKQGKVSPNMHKSNFQLAGAKSSAAHHGDARPGPIKTKNADLALNDPTVERTEAPA